MLNLGTRKSPLALAQSKIVADALGHCTLVPMSTKGDEWLSTPLTELGGKGLFTKELDEALLKKDIDLAVHSLKDMPTDLPEGIIIGAILPREDVRDCWVGTPLAELKTGAKIGTASLRRAVQIKAVRADVEIVPIRGNVQTRLEKVGKEVEATILARAGLKRLGIAADELMSVETMLPAVGQGAIAVVCRAGDFAVQGLLAQIHCEATFACITAERAMLRALDGSCRTPIAGLATLAGETLTLHGLRADVDGSNLRKATLDGSKAEAEALGLALARQLQS